MFVDEFSRSIVRQLYRSQATFSPLRVLLTSSLPPPCYFLITALELVARSGLIFIPIARLSPVIGILAAYISIISGRSFDEKFTVRMSFTTVLISRFFCVELKLF